MTIGPLKSNLIVLSACELFSMSGKLWQVKHEYPNNEGRTPHEAVESHWRNGDNQVIFLSAGQNRLTPFFVLAMPFEPARFTLTKSPLAIVLAQFCLRHPVLEPTLAQLRHSLRAIGLERLTKKNERSVSVSPGSLNPAVKDTQISVLLDTKSTKGVSFAGNAFSYFTGRHTSFAEFVEDLSSIIDAVSRSGPSFEATSVALRYINVFEIGSEPTTVVKRSLGGLDRRGLGKDHHHHNYEFWCDTDHSRLTVRFSTTHGDRKPAQLGHAEAVFPPECLRSYDDNVGHLDIFANTRNLGQPADWLAAQSILQDMNLRIEQAFLNAIDEAALIETFGAREKP